MKKIAYKALNFFTANRNLCLLILCVFISMSQTFAASGSASLGVFDDVGNKLLEVLTSTGLKAALAILLAGCFGGIAWGKLKGQDGIVSTLVPVFFGIAGILGSVSLVSWIYDGVTVGSFS